MNTIFGFIVDVVFASIWRFFFPEKVKNIGEAQTAQDPGKEQEELDGEETRPTPLWLLVLMAPFTLIGILLKPLEMLLQLIFAPIEMLLPKSWRGDDGLLGTIKTIVYAVMIALVIRTVAYEPFNIPSGSMKPTLLVGDYLFVSKFSYGYSNYALGFGTDLDLFDGRLYGREPERGDVAVFRKPTDTSTDFIKRIVGLPGDTAQVIDGVLHINGEPVELEPTLPFIELGCERTQPIPQEIETLPNGVSHAVLNATDLHRYDNTEPVEVPHRQYFMMGDNRDRSNDSRAPSVGMVPYENLIGRAEFLFFSTNGCGSLYAPWTWPSSIRWDRLFMAVE